MKYLLLPGLLFLLCWSCSTEPVETIFYDFDTENGVFVACEGNFMYGNGSLSFYNTLTGTVTNRVFYARNNAPLGDVVQSLASHGSFMYIVVNNSGKIYVVDQETVEFRGVIKGLTSPRYIHFLSGEKAYVSDLYAHHITIIDPQTFRITGTIGLEGHTSEQMVEAGNYVFASSWSEDNHLLVIDPSKDQLAGKIEVPFQPMELEVDKHGKIWILSGGSTPGMAGEQELPALTRVDPQTLTIEQIYRFQSSSIPAGLEINKSGDTLYYLNGGLYKMAITSRYLPQSELIPAGDRLFYRLAIHQETGEIYLSDAIDYTQDAIVYRFSRNATPLDTFRVGINPSDFLFR